MPFSPPLSLSPPPLLFLLSTFLIPLHPHYKITIPEITTCTYSDEALSVLWIHRSMIEFGSRNLSDKILQFTTPDEKKKSRDELILSFLIKKIERIIFQNNYNKEE